MAIIALIVTPLVMSIIRKAKISADKRSVDAYGRSIELAIAGYLMDNGFFPTSIDQLTIEYSGEEVVCTITQLNSDSSIYLAGCTVGGRSVDGYTYGGDKSPSYTAYVIGDTVTYNNVDYYVIKDSGIKESTVTLLKAEPLSVAEVNEYGAGHVNRYTFTSPGTAYNKNGYGSMAYYTSETCGYVNNSWVYDGCTTDYTQSDIKYVVDAWKISQAPGVSEARLITYDELIDDLGYDPTIASAGNPQRNDNVPVWVYNSNYWYWTSSQHPSSFSFVWLVLYDDLNGGSVMNSTYFGGYSDGRAGVVRPVIVLPKSAID